MITLLTIGMLLQSVPVLAAQESSTGGEVLSDLADPSVSENSDGSPDSEVPDNPSDLETPSDPSDAADPEEPSDTEAPENSGEITDTEAPEDSGEITDTEAPEDSEEDPDTEAPEDTERIRPAAVSQEEEVTEEVNGGEGIYQEGSFTVLGESASQGFVSGYRSARLVESDRAEVEEYLYRQMLAKSTAIDIRKYQISREDTGSFVSGVINEHPDLYFVSGFSYSYGATSGMTVSISPKYLDGFDDNAFWAAVDDAMSVIDGDMSDLEKAIALHDHIILNCEYDYQNYLDRTLPREVYTSYGVLVNCKAVCQGYALAYKLLLNRAGIECYMVTSDEMNHAWNLVKLDGQYYQVDTTWDDPVWDRFGLASHRYMFLSDTVFQTESGVRSRHYGWTITKGSLTVDLTADSALYDDEFWIGCNSPLILDNDMCYYIESGGSYYTGYGILKARNMATGMESVILNGIGLWTSSGGGYWPNAYSGLFRIGDRLYYNTPSHICSIPMNGGEVGTETELLPSGGKSVYGSALSRGQVWYLLKASPNETKGDILPATLLQGIETEVSRIALDPEEITISTGQTAELRLVLQPSYADAGQVVWASDNEAVATVEAGRITAVQEGNCAITVSAGDKSAQCLVTVLDRPHKPVFSPEKTVDQGGQVTITSDPGTKIYYTVNGQDPDPSDTTVTIPYTEPVTMEEDTTLKAIAVFEHNAEIMSDIAEERFLVCTNALILETDALTVMEGSEQAIGVKEIPTTKTAADIRWSSDDTAVAAVDENGIVTGISGGEAVVTAQVEDHKGEVVTALCSVTVDVPEYQVVFIGYEDRIIKTERVRKRESATAPYYDPEDPEKSELKLPAGYRFTGWKGSYENIQADTVITAQYEPIAYKIIYETNGGTAAADNPGTYTVEDEIRLNPPETKEGCLFTGWYEDEECQGNPLAVIGQGTHRDITLYAGWKDERGLWMKVKGSDEVNSIPPQHYTGKAVSPEIEVWYGDRLLDPGKEYTISYKNHTNANRLDTEAARKKAPTVTIKGKGNFAGTLTKTFVILPKSLGEEETDVQADPMAAAYNNGKAVRPVPVVLWNGKKLTHKKDFTVEYPDQETGNPDAYIEPDTWTVLIKGCGNYKGERPVELKITDPGAGEVLLGKVKVSKIPDQIYNGEAVALTQDMLRLTMGTEILAPEEDYTLEGGIYTPEDGSYRLKDGSCTEIGTHQILIVGRGNYKGVRRVSFKIKGLPVSSMKISSMPKLVYTGERVTLDPNAPDGAPDKLIITDQSGEAVLEENKDYTLEFSNCENVGNAKVKITGKGAYSGSVTKTYKILPCPLTEGSEDITASLAVEGAQTWQAGGASPKVLVTFHGEKLTEGTDYTLSYRNNKSLAVKAGKDPTVVIKGKKNFTGTRELTFTMKQADLAHVTITAPDLEENSKAGKYMSTPVLTDVNGRKLKAGTDYEKTFVYTDVAGVVLDKTDRPEAGKRLIVRVTGKGNYEGTVETSFRIIAKGKNVAKAKVKINGTFEYTGGRITLTKQDLTVTMGKTTLSEADYDIVAYSYLNNIDKGTAKVTIRGRGDYGGTKQISFRILSQNMKWWERILH